MEIKRLILLFFLVLISVTVNAQQPPVAEPEAQVEEHEPEYVAPRFKGGDANNFAKWVTRKLVYPKDAKQKLLEGTVHLSFVVEADGSVSNVTVKQGVCESLDAEAVRVVSSSPKWKPGTLDGNPARISYDFPVVFALGI